MAPSFYKKIIVPFVIFGFFFSCTQDPFKGFSKTETGLLFKIHVIGDGQLKPVIGDKVMVNIHFMDRTGNSIKELESGSGVKNLTLQDSLGDLAEALMMMNEGDSASFVFFADSVFQKEFKHSAPEHLKGQEILINISLIGINNYTDRDYEELKNLQLYVKENKLEGDMLSGGIFFEEIKKGEGQEIKYGERVAIHYTGKFLDGKQFDSTYDMQSPFEFSFGATGQIIKGMEIGISKMKAGGAAKMIIPSFLAFGEAGSSTGIVPPFTTLIYEVEVVNVEHSKLPMEIEN